jgi:pimeloyl-ACP methyl ester carboxylesterase
MVPLEMSYLRRRFARTYHYDARSFAYRSVIASMADHVRGLREFVQTLNASELHFVGHSLGGVVVLRLLESTNDLPPGRAVLLGSPLQGSRSAQGIKTKIPFGAAVLGQAINRDVLSGAPREWDGRRDVGVIAGTRAMGLGRIIADLPGAHDGTVTVEETQLPGAKDHMTLPVSHSGLVFSPEVARQTDAFLRAGRFLPAVS